MRFVDPIFIIIWICMDKLQNCELYFDVGCTNIKQNKQPELTGVFINGELATESWR
jgi:hypothetical protein